ncbi:hypothetical protein ACCD08_25255 [Telluria sp. Tellsp104]
MNARRLLSLLTVALAPLIANAAEYQWSVTVDTVVSSETNAHPRAFLWVPPGCDRIRAVVIGQHNMQEEPILEHPVFRREMAALCFGEVWVTPAMGSNHFRFDRGAGAMLDRLMAALAERSGYTGLARAPLVPLGHSAMASFGWDMAAWAPQRVLAVISTSGMWPYFKDTGEGNAEPPDWGDRTVDGVPGLVVKGEYEVQGNMRDGWYAGLEGDSLQRHPQTVLTHVIEPGGGHFDASGERVALMALFLRKAAHYRLGGPAAPDGSTPLIPVDPRRTGWLYEGWQLDTAPAAPAAPVAAYRGARADAYWAFDGEMAAAIETLQARFRHRRPLAIGYRQRDGIVPPSPDHAMIHLTFEPFDDDLHFRLAGAFRGDVPNDPGGLRIDRICGPVVQTGPDTFAIRFYRMGMTNAKRSNDVWFALTWPGDGNSKRTVQQAELRFPLTNTEGREQTLRFPAIPDQRADGPLAPIRLGATSSAGAPVHYYVREGPAEVSDDGVLTFTALPRRARFPIDVTIVAWQWGRATEPRLRSAAPVERHFLITQP